MSEYINQKSMDDPPRPVHEDFKRYVEETTNVKVSLKVLTTIFRLYPKFQASDEAKIARDKRRSELTAAQQGVIDRREARAAERVRKAEARVAELKAKKEAAAAAKIEQKAKHGPQETPQLFEDAAAKLAPAKPAKKVAAKTAPKKAAVKATPVKKAAPRKTTAKPALKAVPDLPPTPADAEAPATAKPLTRAQKALAKRRGVAPEDVLGDEY